MQFVLQTPPLQHLAGVKIVAHLWNQRDIFTQIVRLPAQKIREEANEWKAIEDIGQSKVSALPLPERCKKQLLNFVKPLGMEIKDWCHYHRGGRNEFLDILLSNQLRWTMHGIIDYGKTAELMVKDEMLDVERRYEIACINCLEDQARELFPRIGEEDRKEYINTCTVRNDESTGLYSDLIIFITCIIHENRLPYAIVWSSHSLIKKRLFENSLCRGNRATCEYLFRKLNQREKEQVLYECQRVINSCRKSPTFNLLYYLSLMSEEQQARMFRECALELLLGLLRWPMQSLFVQAAEYGWGNNMDRDARIFVLLAIISKIQSGFEDYDYAQLFCDCWRLTTPADSTLLCFDESGILISLLLTKREELLKLILNEATSVQVERAFHLICLALIDENSINISDAALMECKQTALLNSSNDRDNVEKRFKSQRLSELVDLVLESRILDGKTKKN